MPAIEITTDYPELKNLFEQILKIIKSGISCIDIELAFKWNTIDYQIGGMAKVIPAKTSLVFADIVQAYDKNGNTLLHHFSTSYLDTHAVEDFEILFKKMLAAGANINSKNKVGLTILDSALNHSPCRLTTNTVVAKEAILKARESTTKAMIKILQRLGAKTSQELEMVADPVEEMQQVLIAEVMEKDSSVSLNIPKLGCR